LPESTTATERKTKFWKWRGKSWLIDSSSCRPKPEKPETVMTAVCARGSIGGGG